MILNSLAKIYTGKVRDVYKINDNTLLMIATDRISAFDIVFPNLIPNKGKILTQISLFWFDKLKHLIKNHLSETDFDLKNILTKQEYDYIDKRFMVVKFLKPIKIEAIVRGYATNSMLQGMHNGDFYGHQLPNDLKFGSKLAKPIFTPSSKNSAAHDQNLTLIECSNLIGKELTEKIQNISLKLYDAANEIIKNFGLLIADTKFEFAISEETGELILIDEIFTPDSSRIWNLNKYNEGKIINYDKQFFRDHLERLDWDKNSPINNLPKNLIEDISKLYCTLAQKLNIII